MTAWVSCIQMTDWCGILCLSCSGIQEFSSVCQFVTVTGVTAGSHQAVTAGMVGHITSQGRGMVMVAC